MQLNEKCITKIEGRGNTSTRLAYDQTQADIGRARENDAQPKASRYSTVVDLMTKNEHSHMEYRNIDNIAGFY